MTRLFWALPMALGATSAFAQGTPEEAARLTSVFQTYLGTVEGVVTVVPEGEGYTLTLDAAPFVAMIPADAGASVTVSPLVYALTDNGDDTWGVTQDQGMEMSFAVPGQMDMKLAVASMACEGTFDEALVAFSENACTIENLTMDQTITDPVAGNSKVTYTVASGEYTTSSVAGANGGVDTTMSYTMQGLDEMIEIPMAPDSPPVPIHLTVENYTVDGTATGARNAEVLGLIAWFVARPSEAQITADKADLKATIAAGLPFWDHLEATGLATNINVTTPVGPIAIAEAGVDVELSGAIAEGYFREAIRIKGITPPPGVLPPFAEPLLPQEFTIDVAADRFDLAATAQVLLGLFDLPAGQEPGPEFQGALLQAILPEGEVGVTLAPGVLSNDMYNFTYEGTMTAGPMAPPTGQGRITATGLDQVMSTLGSAPPEMTGDILPVLGMAQGLAQPGPNGELVWEIDATVPGTFKVNGMDLMGMQ